MKFNKNQFINDALKEYERVDKLRYKARKGGKRSKATINFQKLWEKYGVSQEGYGFLDMFFSHITMATMGDMISFNDPDSLREKAEKALNDNKQLLEDELKQMAV